MHSLALYKLHVKIFQKARVSHFVHGRLCKHTELNRRDNRSYYNYSSNFFCFFFSLLLLFCMLSTIFLCDNGVYEAFLFQFLNCYSLLNDGNSPFWTQQISSLNESECIVGTPKRWETWLETHAPLLLLIGRIIFLTVEKKIVLDSGWTYNSYAQCLRLKNNSCMCSAIDPWKSNDTLSTSTTSTIHIVVWIVFTPKLLCSVLTKAAKKIENFNSICKQFRP